MSLVEVKSGKSYKRHVALDNLMAVVDHDIAEAIVPCDSNVQMVKGRSYLPIYAAGWLQGGRGRGNVASFPGGYSTAFLAVFRNASGVSS